MRRLLALSVWLLASQAWAQFDGNLPPLDASLPDASVGEGNPDMMEENEDGRLPVFCEFTRDCERGFSCIEGRCKYTGARYASCSCDSAAFGLAAVPFVLLWRSRRRRH